MAQRQNDILNLFFIVRLPNGQIYVNEQLTQTSNVKSSSFVLGETRYASADAAFQVECVEPMQRWKIAFKGRLVERKHFCSNVQRCGEDSTQLPLDGIIDAEAEFEWQNRGEYFDFDVDVSPRILAESLALEPWSREMFASLRASHQTHYEQFGVLRGYFQLNGQERIDGIEMISMRDHTITRFRKWNQIRRYSKKYGFLKNLI